MDCGFTDNFPSAGIIRFPIDRTSTSYRENDVVLSDGVAIMKCMWQHCTTRLKPDESILEHIQTVHVASQDSVPASRTSRSNSGADAGNCGEFYYCHWEGCKVQGQMSTSKEWLRTHVFKHGGPKPFRCIFYPCQLGFNSEVIDHNKLLTILNGLLNWTYFVQAALQRHVNAHMKKESGAGSDNQGHFKRNNAPSKAAYQNVKKQCDSNVAAGMYEQHLVVEKVDQISIVEIVDTYF